MTARADGVTGPSVRLLQTSFESLPGWTDNAFGEALAVFRRSAREMLETGSGFRRDVTFGGSQENWQPACQEALSSASPRSFFEQNFIPFRVEDPARPEGLFTGYYEPESSGSRVQSVSYRVPLYRAPPDLVAFTPEEQRGTGLSYGRLRNGKPQPYFTREEIEQGALQGRGLELCWLKSPEDAYFIHIQGSGRIRFEDESVMRLSFAAKSGRPYTSIGGLLVERGIISRENMSMQAIRAWMAAHPTEARHLMWENQSFIFFREVELPDPSLGAYGAQHVQLTPRRSIAVDRNMWMFGTPVWIDCPVPGPETRLRSLTIAQDTGSAILGGARADVFWGFGDAAGAIAGEMKSTGTMTVLLPHLVAAELGLL